ncbi:uncharacterized protein LOC142165916 [Nicotiana tabacum]|uniref:Uncharacterized protein LOC142165916 n=1 Tax=Nicotiana tabacum TaxID=4097 RepID=A0AC58S5Y2_TOBAC
MDAEVGVRAPFLFENIWLNVPGFGDNVKEWWTSYGVSGTPSFCLSKKLKLLKGDIIRWNKEVFGRVEVKKRELMHELEELEKGEGTKELDESEKARLRRVAVANRRRNFIESSVVDRVRIEGEEEVKGAIVGFYDNLYKEELCWDTIKGELMEAIEYFHVNGVFKRSINASFITIVPKKEGASCIKDYMPISLVRSIYKIISKVLSNRLKKVLDVSVSSSQNAFVEGRQILDTTLVANELVDSKRKNREPGLLCMLDLEKAFDHVNWEFLDFIMMRMVFGVRWRGWIKFCISSVRLSVLVNGSLCGFFGSSRDLRQGWQKRYLSKGSKEVLIKSTLSSMPTYYLYLLQAPVSITEKLERLQRNFLWDAADGTRKFHLVNWQTVTSPKKWGGLGVKDLRVFNKAFLGKWLWRFGVEEHALWKENQLLES